MHSLWLKVGKKVLYRQQPWKGSLEAVSRQGFKQEDDMKGFGVMNPPNFSRCEVLSNRGDDSCTKFE
jgi:hypothetical protein